MNEPEPSAPPPPPTPFSLEYYRDPRVLRLLGCTIGLMGFFIMYGILQERIMTVPFDEEGTMFTNSAFLVLNNRVVAALCALFILYYRGEEIKPAAPIWKFSGISISNSLATLCQYEALKYISFPTQTLGKCGKMIPVMIVGTIISGKRYSLKDYGAAFFLTLGCTLFFLLGDIGTSHSSKSDTPWGLFLVAGYLFCDGFTSTFQEKLFKGHSMSTYNQMLYVNLWSGLLSIIALVGADQLWDSIEFCFAHPSLFFMATGLSLCAMFGQLVIYYTIKEFGALVFSTIMTTRQFFSILLSCLLFFHPLTPGQWIGTIIVFAVLYYKAVDHKPHHAHPPANSAQNKV